MNDEPESIRLAVSAALAHQYSAETSEFLGYLVTILNSSMKDRLTIREKGIFKKTLQGISVDLEQGKLNLDLLPSGSVNPTFTRVVRGIALKTEQLEIAEWIEMLSESMDKIAASSEKSRNALANLINLP